MTGRIKTEWEKKMKFTQSIRLIAIFAILALLLPAFASAQSVVTGGINGTVSDASGAVFKERPYQRDFRDDFERKRNLYIFALEAR